MESKKNNKKSVVTKVSPKIDDHVIRGYIFKTGFVYPKITPEFDPITRKDRYKEFQNNYLKDLYKVLSSTDSIMEISPSLDETNNISKPYEFSVLLPHKYPSLAKFLDIRVAISERRRTELIPQILLYDRFTPENFHLFFDGSLYFAISEIYNAPISTDIGHVSRELLKQAIEKIEYTEINPIGPSPIHIDFYFLVVENNIYEDKDYEPIIFKNDNLYIMVPESVLDKNTFFNFVFNNCRRTMNKFYNLEIIRSEILDLLREFNQYEFGLSTLLSKYFDMNFVSRICNKHANQMRKTISQIHLSMNDISKKQILYDNQRLKFFRELSDDRILHFIERYFENHIEENLLCFDYKTELSIMNFTIAETSDRMLIQATLLSAIIGGLIGSLFSLLK